MTAIHYQTLQTQGHGPIKGVGWGSQEVAAYNEFTVPAAGFVTNADDLTMLWVPKGAIFSGGFLNVDDLDGATSLTLSVGDSGSTTRFLSGSTIGQAGGNVALTLNLGYKFTADTIIKVTATAAAGTPAGGVIRLCIKYLLDPAIA